MNSNSLKKLGRRKANTWGRCGSKKEKRYASKGVRKSLNELLQSDLSLEDIDEIIEEQLKNDALHISCDDCKIWEELDSDQPRTQAQSFTFNYDTEKWKCNVCEKIVDAKYI